MRTLFMIALLGLMTACSTTESAASLFDRLEFKEGQEGCIRASGQIAVGGNPIASSSVNVNMVKKQGEDPPDC